VYSLLSFGLKDYVSASVLDNSKMEQFGKPKGTPRAGALNPMLEVEPAFIKRFLYLSHRQVSDERCFGRCELDFAWKECIPCHGINLGPIV
jgi:hypothetical protein